MPRRNFFRGPNSDKKASRKQQKYDGKINRQQQHLKHQKEEQFHQQQVIQQQSSHNDRLQASSSTHGSDPPLNLNGPTRTAPKHPSICGQQYTSHTHKLTGNLAQVHESYDMHSRHYQQPYDNQHIQQHEDEMNLDEVRRIEQEQLQHQQHSVHHSPIQQHQFHPSAQCHEHNVEQNYLVESTVPTVENATDEMWRCGTGDFRSGSMAIQLLRLAVVTDWEQRQQQNAEFGNGHLTSFSYDPSETFLSLQGAALRFHANFESMRAKRNAKVNDACAHDIVEGPDSLEWELTEQAAWEVWEESLRATAALAHASVGPGWRHQLDLRKQLNHEGAMRAMYGSSLHRNRVVFDNLSDGGSSIGGHSFSSYSFDVSNPQSSGRPITPGNDLAMPEVMPDIVETFRVIIPEVLPAAMIRFAASALDCTPSLRTAQSKIVWKEEQSQQQMQSIVLQQINDERRWIRRLKRLGDTQRDLAFALFCVGGGASDDEKIDFDNQQGASKKWTIPRVHTVMASLICSWLSSCSAGWPVPKLLDKVPCHFEEIFTETGEADIPPSEIILTDRTNASESLDTVQAPEVEGDQISPLLVKFSFWNEIVDVSRKDWWYTLRVLRDCSDLVSSGWCPPPSGIGNNIVFLLINIALDGLSPLGDVKHPDIQLTGEQICRENLVACSCAAESLATLKNLAAQDVLPLDSLDLLATSLCKLLSASEETISFTIAANDESVKSSDTLLEKETYTQRTFVASNCAELLWILLSTESTCCSTCDALLNLIDDSLIPENTAANIKSSTLTASGAVRALSAALWGDPPAVKGVPLLRYFWEMVVEVFGKVLNINATVCNEFSVTFSLEIIFGLRRLIDNELVYGNGDLIPTEWETLIRAIDAGILPWLAYKFSDIKNTDLLDEIYALFTQIKRFLIKVPEECGVHPIMDDEARNNFHAHIMRKCVPLLKAEDAAALGLAAIKSWSCVSYLPCRESGWLTHATNLLSEAFAQYDDICDASFPGGYVHSPFVRLEALKSLLIDQGSSQQHFTDSGSVATSISGVTSGTSISGALPILSLFTLTRNLRDLHLELIKKLLLPTICAILSPEYNAADIHPVAATFVPANPHTSEEVRSHHYSWECAEAEFLLRKFAVRVVGLLFKSRSGEQHGRHHLISLLKHVAVSKPHDIEGWSIFNDDTGGFTSSHTRLEMEIFRLRLEAIRQLELCLQVPFRELPHTHGNLPGILNALCETVTSYASQERDTQLDYHKSALLCLAAIIPLSRLSRGRNGQGIFLMRDQVTRSIPDCITSIISDDGWIECCSPMLALHQSLPIVFEEECLGTDTDEIAPFVFVRQWKADAAQSSKRREESANKKFRRHVNNGSEGSDKTTIDIEPVATVVKLALHSYGSGTTPKNESPDEAALTNLSSIIRIVCLHTISSFLSHGIPFPNSLEDDWLDVKSESVEELVSRSEAASLLASIIGSMLLSSKIHVEEDFVVKICDVLARLAVSQTHPTVTKNSCCGIVTLLTSISKFGRKVNKAGQLSVRDTLTPLINHMCTLLECNEDSHLPGFVLIPLMNVTRASILCPEFVEIKKQLRRRILLACLKVNGQLPWHLKVIAFFMGSAVIDLMTSQEAELVLFLASSGVGNTFPDNQCGKRHQPLLVDVLRSKILYKRLSDAHKKTSFSNERQPSFVRVVHSQLARKMIAIENFPLDSENGLAAAWKCGDILLTLRMGSRSSLYRGWIEVVLRSASCTVRRLVKVDKEISAEDPDSLLPFWELLQPLEEGKAGHHQNITDAHSELPDSQNDALSLIERFDQLIQNDPQTNEPEISDPPVTYSTNQSDDVHVSAVPVLKRRKLKRSFSDGDILCSPVDLHPKEDTRQGNHVNSWVGKTFGDYLDGADLLRDLEVLGFTSASLGVEPATSCPNLILYNERLKPCKMDDKFTRAVKILDRTTPFQTHRVSLLYGGPLSQKGRTTTTNKTDGDQFLLATQASPDFWAFAKELGDIVPVRHLKYFSGGLDTSESLSDGSFAIVWFNCKGDVSNIDAPLMVDSMVMFHTVTLMPNKVTNRKRHVGNDIVHIVYGLETETLDVDHERLAISGHFGFVTIYVIPFDDMVKISIHLKTGLDESICSALSHLVGSRVVSRKTSADVVRTLAQEADLICLSMIEEKLGLVLNTEERASKIKDMNRHLSYK